MPEPKAPAVLRLLKWAWTRDYFRFIAVGATAFIVDFGVMSFLFRILHLDYRISFVAGVLVATAWAFLLNKLFTFQDKSTKWKEQTVLFFSGRLLSLVVTYFLQVWMVEKGAAFVPAFFQQNPIVLLGFSVWLVELKKGTDQLIFNPLLAKVFNGLVNFVINYFFAKLVVFRKKPASTQSAGAVVLDPKGRILVVSQHGTSWSLPKGHIEDGEDRIAAARRETLEEAGVENLEMGEYLGHYERFRIGKNGKDDRSEWKQIHLYLARTSQTRLAPRDPENPEARWVDRSEVEAFLTHPVDKAFWVSILPRLPKGGVSPSKGKKTNEKKNVKKGVPKKGASRTSPAKRNPGRKTPPKK